ncbi:hypothetical protein B0H13DRAFT_2358546 [Mycena leptocephala]|nr:hypothetical protein B0H13DRAFT_2358546 [Mycena leptocephala]
MPGNRVVGQIYLPRVPSSIHGAVCKSASSATPPHNALPSRSACRATITSAPPAHRPHTVDGAVRAQPAPPFLSCDHYDRAQHTSFFHHPSPAAPFPKLYHSTIRLSPAYNITRTNRPPTLLQLTHTSPPFVYPPHWLRWTLLSASHAPPLSTTSAPCAPRHPRMLSVLPPSPPSSSPLPVALPNPRSAGAPPSPSAARAPFVLDAHLLAPRMRYPHLAIPSSAHVPHLGHLHPTPSIPEHPLPFSHRAPLLWVTQSSPLAPESVECLRSQTSRSACTLYKQSAFSFPEMSGFSIVQ